MRRAIAAPAFVLAATPAFAGMHVFNGAGAFVADCLDLQ
jgi:hypothetical protein